MEQKTLTGYPSIDKPWLKYYSEEAINAPLPECTVYEYIWQHNKDYLDDIALEYFGCKTTYEKLFCEVERTAKALRQAGVQKGDCVALCMAGVPEAVYLVLACSRIGATANFINPMFTTEQIIDRINDTEADLLIVLDAMYRFIADAIDKTCVKRVAVVPATGSLPAPSRALARLKKKPDKRLLAAMRDGDKDLPWKAFIKAGERYTKSVDEPYEKDRPVVMVYSSGTTGASKGIQLTNDGINATIQQYAYSPLKLERHQTILNITPPWFSTGLSFTLLMPLSLGITVIMEPEHNLSVIAKDICMRKPNHIILTPSYWTHLLDKNYLNQDGFERFIYPMTGGDFLPESIEKRINAHLYKNGCRVSLQKGWGQCELGSTIVASDGIHQVVSSVGIPLSKVVVSVFDPETDKELPYGQRGELRVISPCRMLGYYKNPQATAEFFRAGKDGQIWGCTGDIGYMDEDGNVFILGRASDYFIAANGEKVYLFDIENAILQDEAVELCEVVTVGADGRSPVAHVVLTPNASTDQTGIIRRINRLCRAQLTEYAAPIAYKIRESFPVKPSGKRDTEVLKTERDGFVDAEGNAVDFHAQGDR